MIESQRLKPTPRSFSPLMIGSVSLFVALLWMLLAVQVRYHGQWAGLFHVGGGFSQPPEIAVNVFVAPDDKGYDGQFYRLVARDPFLKRGYAQYVDAPEIRWRRILVPLLAWTLALGQDAWLDGAYIAVVLGWVFAGAFWAAQLACSMGYPAWMGTGFLLVPATLVSLDRMTVDVALAALLLGVLRYCEEGPDWLVWLLAAAALSRETGVLLVAALVLNAIHRKRFRVAGWMAAALSPAVVWWLFVHLNIPRSGVVFWGWIPLEGILRRFAHPIPYAAGVPFRPILILLDYLALSGALLGVLLMLRYRPSPGRMQGVAAWLFLVPALFVSFPDAWSDPFAYGRTMTPFWILIALEAAARREWLGLLPMVLIDLPIGAQFAYYIAAFLKSQ